MVGGSNPPSATSPPDDPIDSLAAAVERGARAVGLPDGADLVLAVSGGSDSMALLHGASRLVRSGARSWALTVAHLDHGLRPESPDDAAFVRSAATSLGLRAEERRVDVGSLAERRRLSIEEAGREARYAFLSEVAGGGWVATGHTADDAAETVLINLLRGSGVAGLRGIPARRDRTIRPLLGERRAALRSSLDAAGVAYREDASNRDPTFLRNRIRSELLPLLEELRPGAVEALTRHASLAGDDDELLDGLAVEELARRRAADGTIDWREPPPRALGRRILRLALGQPAISAERIEALLDAAEGPRGGVVIELGAGREASVRGRRITIG